MADPIQGPNSYLDFAGIGRLRGQARNDRSAATREVAQQFEAMFIQMMMKSMREATFKSGFLDSSAMETYQGMYDRELSVQMAKRGMLGISDMLTRQLEAASAPPPPADRLALPQIGNGAGLPGLPLATPRPGMPLQQPARDLALPRARNDGFPLQQSPTGMPAPSGDE